MPLRVDSRGRDARDAGAGARDAPVRARADAMGCDGPADAFNVHMPETRLIHPSHSFSVRIHAHRTQEVECPRPDGASPALRP
ncbi:hypothetical protein GCM10022288_19430 [Gryllotalpicola kribbensis]|uniref:Uncharacterized protein n=1 Tax=Gryllotalpicola kribbensis TaxID=993084 RepID=A0ABP8AUD4_9MICO